MCFIGWIVGMYWVDRFGLATPVSGLVYFGSVRIDLFIFFHFQMFSMLIRRLDVEFKSWIKIHEPKFLKIFFNVSFKICFFVCSKSLKIKYYDSFWWKNVFHRMNSRDVTVLGRSVRFSHSSFRLGLLWFSSHQINQVKYFFIFKCFPC